jgi:GGDEF domain-containing protein
LDIDGLIWVNDQYGHSEGDRVLANVARYLLHCGDKHGGSVFRVGGDEFLLLVPGSADRFVVGEIAEEIVAGVAALRIPYRRMDRPDRSTLEINAAVVRTTGAFADRGFSEFGITTEVRNWVGESLFKEKKRLGRDAGLVVNLFDAPDCPWTGA